MRLLAQEIFRKYMISIHISGPIESITTSGTEATEKAKSEEARKQIGFLGENFNCRIDRAESISTQREYRI
jgi:hypothetical protein